VEEVPVVQDVHNVQVVMWRF